MTKNSITITLMVKAFTNGAMEECMTANGERTNRLVAH